MYNEAAIGADTQQTSVGTIQESEHVVLRWQIDINTEKVHTCAHKYAPICTFTHREKKRGKRPIDLGIYIYTNTFVYLQIHTFTCIYTT